MLGFLLTLKFLPTISSPCTLTSLQNLHRTRICVQDRTIYVWSRVMRCFRGCKLCAIYNEQRCLSSLHPSMSRAMLRQRKGWGLLLEWKLIPHTITWLWKAAERKTKSLVVNSRPFVSKKKNRWQSRKKLNEGSRPLFFLPASWLSALSDVALSPFFAPFLVNIPLLFHLWPNVLSIYLPRKYSSLLRFTGNQKYRRSLFSSPRLFLLHSRHWAYYIKKQVILIVFSANSSSGCSMLLNTSRFVVVFLFLHFYSSSFFLFYSFLYWIF